MTAEPVPPSEEVLARLAEQGLDYEKSGLQYLSNEARVRSRLHVRCVPGWHA